MNIDSTFIPNSWSGYEAWLKGIYLYLEQNGRTGVPVYLNADESDFDRIRELGKIESSGTSLEDFIKVVSLTINQDDPKKAFARHHQSVRFWNPGKNPGTVPPFLPILMLTVLAAEMMKSDELFVSSNYYGRLAALIKYEAEDKDYVGNSYRNHIAPMWDKYNEWLGQNPRLGKPTAYINVSRGFNDFVGVPIGQALLRSSEQEEIENGFFEKFFNSGGSKDVIDNEEFIDNLDDWVKISNNSRIKILYAQAQDVLRISIWELFERWQPRTRGIGTSGRRAGLKLVLRMSSRFAKRSSRFSLNTNFENTESGNVSAKITTGDSEPFVVSALPDEYLGIGTMMMLDDHLSDVFARNTTIKIDTGAESGLSEEVIFSASRQPRAIIPFETVVPGTWVETLQMKLGESYVIVTARETLEHTMALLQKFGTGATLTSVSGLPDQWRLITGFTATSSIGAPDNLPIQKLKGIQLSIVDGVRLPGSSGIAEFPITEPPKIMVTQMANNKNPILRIEGPSEWQRDYSDFENLICPDFSLAGEYVVRLFENAKSRNSVSYRRFVLRDSDTPRFMPAASESSLGMRFFTDNRIVVDFGDSIGEVSTLIQGARLLRGDVSPFSRSRIIQQISEQTFEPGEETWDEELVTISKASELAKCITNPNERHLRVVIDRVVGRRQRFQRWVCSDCGAAGAIDTRSKNKNQVISPKILPSTELPVVDAASLVEREVEQLQTPRDLIEKRIWTLGGGRLREASSFSELNDRSFVTQVLWSLAVSGHIDISSMEDDLCSGDWRTNPMTIVPFNNQFRLVGHMSLAVVDMLRQLLADVGAELNKVTHLDSTYISDFVISGADGAKIKTITEEMNKDYGEVVKLDESVAPGLLASLPPLSNLRNQLQTHSYVDTFRTTEYFDLNTAKWELATNKNLVGCLVRDAKYGTTYRFVVGGDPISYQAIKCGYRLGKHLSAQWKQFILTTYDAEKQELSTPLGAELPLLYSRGVVFLTGSMPYRVKNQTVYNGVSALTYEKIRFLLSE